MIEGRQSTSERWAAKLCCEYNWAWLIFAYVFTLGTALHEKVSEKIPRPKAMNEN